jgi:hypothetical protein
MTARCRGWEGDGEGEGALTEDESSRKFLEEKTDDAFRVRKRQPFIHASRIEGNHDQVESIVEDEGGEGRRRTHRYEGLRKSHQGTDRDNERGHE